MIDATAIIMTKNEEKNIGDCLKSMQNFAKRCVVIDCGSTDKTVEIAGLLDKAALNSENVSRTFDTTSGNWIYSVK